MRFPWRRDRRRELAEPAWLLKLPHRYGVPQCFQVQLAKARYKAGPYSGAGKSPPAERQWAGALTHLLGRGRHTFSVPLIFSTRPHSVPRGAFLPKYNFICLTDNYLSLASKICWNLILEISLPFILPLYIYIFLSPFTVFWVGSWKGTWINWCD